MNIRYAKESDMPQLLDIYNYEVLNGTATFDLQVKTLEERMVWFLEHNIDNHPLIVAEIDENVVAYASLSSYREKAAYHATVELSIYVDIAYRRRGIARKLLGCLLDEAKSREDIHTIISVITEGNDRSIALHEEFGFVYCGTMKEVGLKFGKMLGIVNYQLILE